MSNEVTRTARIEATWDLDGTLKILTHQRRVVLDRDGKPPVELELLPTELLFVANPTPQDVMTDLAAALGEVNAALLAELVEAKTERDRLRIIVSAFPETSSGDTASAAEGDPT